MKVKALFGKINQSTTFLSLCAFLLMFFNITQEFWSQILHFLLMFWRMKQHVHRKCHWHTNQKSLNKVKLLLDLDKSQDLCWYQQMLQYQLCSPSCPNSTRQRAKQNTRGVAKLSSTSASFPVENEISGPKKEELLWNRVCNDTVIALDCATQEHLCLWQN